MHWNLLPASLSLPHTEAPNDYDAVSQVPLIFSRGATHVCHTITINPDDECELEESFFSDLTLESGIPEITIAPSSAEVIIVDNDEPVCGKYIEA